MVVARGLETLTGVTRVQTAGLGYPKTISGTWKVSPDAVMLVDGHHHLWDLERNYYPWLSDKADPHFFLGSTDTLRRQYLPDDYLRDARDHNVLTTIHVEGEMSRDNQIGETRWLSQLNGACGFPGAIVAHAWFHTEDTEQIISGQAAFPLVRGIRSKPVTALSPAHMKTGVAGSMQDDRWLRGFALPERYGLSWDLRVPCWHLVEAAEVARLFPGTRIALNHTGFPWDRSDEGLIAWRRAMARVAREPNVFLKVSEFGLRDKPWSYEQSRNIVLDALAIFGIERSMFGSNFPVAGLRIDYDQLVRSMKRMVAHLPAEDQDRFFWRNALAFYRVVL
jgi:predicted TIM-barrel fold metal-dependent hydrolase